jgi:hypothetical protein
MDWAPQIRDHVTVQKSLNWYFSYISKSNCISVLYSIFVCYTLQSYKIRLYSDLSVRHRSVWGSGATDPLILYPGNGLRRVVSFTPRLHSGYKSWEGEGAVERTVNSEQFWRWLGLLGLWSLFIITYSKRTRFENWLCCHSQGKGWGET